MPMLSSTWATVTPSTPGVLAPVLRATRSNATSSVAGSLHEIEQVVEPAAEFGRRPTVKLGLHPRYP